MFTILLICPVFQARGTKEMDDKVVEGILKLLRGKSSGLTITDLVNNSRLSRSSIRTALAKLEGAGKVQIRNIGMAKLYTLRGGIK